MTKKEPNNLEDQEIDLLLISKKINNLFQRFNTFLFRCIHFFVKNWMIILILAVVGIGLGVFLDQKQKNYDHQIIVAPSFGSVDYLYSKIDLIESKIKEGDTIFLKEVVGIQKPKEINKIEINPIVDVYKFIEDKPENFELLKIIVEDGTIKKAVEDNLTSKNYPFHTIMVSTNERTNQKSTAQPLLNYLNSDAYFGKLKNLSNTNIQQHIKSKEGIIVQIDEILNGFSNSVRNRQTADKLIYYNENIQLNEIIKTKDSLTKDIGTLKIQLFNSDKIIKDCTTIMNIKNTKSISGKLKFVLPLVFIVGFIFISFFVSFYRKQSLKAQQNSSI
jgi:hypothetical protein